MEIYKDIPGFEGKYQVSNFGKVRSLPREIFRQNSIHCFKGKQLSPLNTGTGYHKVQLGRGFVETIHRLVAKTFIPNPQNKDFVNHIDGDKLNNHVSNLEWVTRQENESHAFATGLKNSSGENNAMSKLKNEDLPQILTYIKEGVADAEIAMKYNVHRVTICRIRNKRIWQGA